MKALFLGFGDLAQRAAPRLLTTGWQVAGLRRSKAAFEGVTLQAGDSRDLSLLARLLPEQDVVVASFTPDDYSENGYRKAYLEPALALVAGLASVNGGPSHVIWISSTSVYGQGEGEWVDETSPTNPSRYSGRLLLEAEKQINECPVPSTVIRFSGIYSQDSTRMVDQVLRQQCAQEVPVKWSNRIHRDDCAGVIDHVCQMILQGEMPDKCYLATDCEPVPLHVVHRWLAQQLGVDCRTVTDAGALRGNRRCRNARLLASGYQFLYPTFREGYGEVLRHLNSSRDI